MPRTVSVTPPSLALTDDIDGGVVDGVESLRQRIVQALRFRIRTWYLDRQAGLDYNLLIGHRVTPALAASTLSSAIREEGGDEIVNLNNVQFSLDRENRVYRYSVNIITVYGDMRISETIG